MMEHVPVNLQTDYWDRNACEIAETCLVSLGMKCPLDAETRNHVLIAGLVAQTILNLEAVSGGSDAGILICLEYNSKLRNLWQGGEQEHKMAAHAWGKHMSDWELRTQRKLDEWKKLMLCNWGKVASIAVQNAIKETGSITKFYVISIVLTLHS